MPTEPNEAEQFSVIDLPQNVSVHVAMERQDGGILFTKLKPKTVFEIITAGSAEEDKIIDPVIDLKFNAEGEVRGPALRFVGSIATKAALYDDPAPIKRGVIIPGERLVVADLEHKGGTQRVLPGIVASVESKKKGRPPKK